MPGVYRAMKKDDDNKPQVGEKSCQLGVRPNEVDIDVGGIVVMNGKGMSVNPSCAEISIWFRPKRLGNGGRGSNNTYCFRLGEVPFQDGACTPGLALTVDSRTHGTIHPAQPMTREAFLSHLADTRQEWVIDEAMP